MYTTTTTTTTRNTTTTTSTTTPFLFVTPPPPPNPLLSSPSPLVHIVFIQFPLFLFILLCVVSCISQTKLCILAHMPFNAWERLIRVKNSKKKKNLPQIGTERMLTASLSIQKVRIIITMVKHRKYREKVKNIRNEAHHHFTFSVAFASNFVYLSNFSNFCLFSCPSPYLAVRFSQQSKGEDLYIRSNNQFFLPLNFSRFSYIFLLSPAGISDTFE